MLKILKSIKLARLKKGKVEESVDSKDKFTINDNKINNYEVGNNKVGEKNFFLKNI